MAPVRTVQSFRRYLTPKVIKRVTLVARRYSLREGGTAETSRKVKGPGYKARFEIASALSISEIGRLAYFIFRFDEPEGWG